MITSLLAVSFSIVLGMVWVIIFQRLEMVETRLFRLWEHWFPPKSNCWVQRPCSGFINPPFEFSPRLHLSHFIWNQTMWYQNIHRHWRSRRWMSNRVIWLVETVAGTKQILSLNRPRRLELSNVKRCRKGVSDFVFLLDFDYRIIWIVYPIRIILANLHGVVT